MLKDEELERSRRVECEVRGDGEKRREEKTTPFYIRIPPHWTTP
jgi:hypothetical protein